MLRLCSRASRILDGRCSYGISPLGITLAVIACGSLFASDCDRVTFKLRLCNLLVELDSLQKSAEKNTTRDCRRTRFLHWALESVHIVAILSSFVITIIVTTHSKAQEGMRQHMINNQVGACYVPLIRCE